MAPRCMWSKMSLETEVAAADDVVEAVDAKEAAAEARKNGVAAVADDGAENGVPAAVAARVRKVPLPQQCKVYRRHESSPCVAIGLNISVQLVRLSTRTCSLVRCSGKNQAISIATPLVVLVK